MTRADAASMVIVRPISSPSPWFSGCRQLAWKGWDRGIGNRLQGHIRSGPRSCHWQKRQHRKRCRRRQDGPGTWLSFGIAREIGSRTSAPFGEKGTFRDAGPRVLVLGPRTTSLSLARRHPPSGTAVRCSCAGARKGRGRPTFCIWVCSS
jgi:hypothetical protein